MVKVKIIKLDERYVETRTKQEEEHLGETREAFEVCLDYEEEEYKKQYALNMGNGVWFLPVDCCEVVKEKPTIEEFKTKPLEVVPPHDSRVLLVEDGSVDVEKLEQDGFYCIVYRQGSKIPEWL